MANSAGGGEGASPDPAAPFPEGCDFDLLQVGPSKGLPNSGRQGWGPEDGPWDQREVPQARSPQPHPMGRGCP